MNIAIAKTSGLTLAAHARQFLEDEIFSGRIPPGSKLDERKIATALDISRTPVREAIRELASLGIINCPPRQQAFVTKTNPSDLVELFEAHVGLETLVAELAARRIRDNEISQLRKIHDRSKLALTDNDSGEFYKLNMDFHEAICNASRNTVLIRQVLHIRARITPYRGWLFGKIDRMTHSFEDHAMIISALEKHDEIQTRKLMRAHELIDNDRLFDFFLSVE